jgi:hypothetical protein
VSNPNYFNVDLQKIEVDVSCALIIFNDSVIITRLKLFYPIKNTPVGGGIATNINFKSRHQTNFTFPFMLSYNSTQAQANAIFSDLATKCGVSGGKTSNLNIDYKIIVSV